MNESVTESEVLPSQTLTVAKMMLHLKNPQNLLNYMIFTAYCKFMGIAEYLPTITVGG